MLKSSWDSNNSSNRNPNHLKHKSHFLEKRVMEVQRRKKKYEKADCVLGTGSEQRRIQKMQKVCCGEKVNRNSVIVDGIELQKKLGEELFLALAALDSRKDRENQRTETKRQKLLTLNKWVLLGSEKRSHLATPDEESLELVQEQNTRGCHAGSQKCGLEGFL